MDYLNRLLRKGGGGSNKKSDKDLSPKSHLNNNREVEIEPDFTSSQHSTPRKGQDCDTESDTTADYESAGESSPWKEKSTNLSALAETLAGVHLSTPNKVHKNLNHFPYSPISAEDEDEEVMSITSSNSQNSGVGSLSLMNEETSKSGSPNNVNVPSALFNSPQVMGTSGNEALIKMTDVNTSKSDGFKSISLAQNEAQLPIEVMNDPLNISSLNDEPKVISPFVEFEDAGPACSFHSELMNSIVGVNSSMLSNTSLIEDCRHETCDKSQTEILAKILENDEIDPEFDIHNLNIEVSTNLSTGSSPSKLDKNKSAILKHILFDTPIDSLTSDEPNPTCQKIEIASVNSEMSKDTVESGQDPLNEAGMQPIQPTEIFEQQKNISKEILSNRSDSPTKAIEDLTMSLALNYKNQNSDVSKIVNEKEMINPKDSTLPLDPKKSAIETEHDQNTDISKNWESSSVNYLENMGKDQLKESDHCTDSNMPEELNNVNELSLGKNIFSTPINQNMASVSDNVLRLANEKHPACIEDSPEKIKTLLSPLKILTSDQIVTSDIPDTVVEENGDSNKGNLSISEMCTLIETTFNNALKENEDEVFIENSHVTGINGTFNEAKTISGNSLIFQPSFDASDNANKSNVYTKNENLVNDASSALSDSEKTFPDLPVKESSFPTTTSLVGKTESFEQKQDIPPVTPNKLICTEQVQSNVSNAVGLHQSPPVMATLLTEISNLSLDPEVKIPEEVPCSKEVEEDISSIKLESVVPLKNSLESRETNEIPEENILDKALNLLDTSDISLKDQSTASKSLPSASLEESLEIPKTPNNSINSSQHKTPCNQEIQNEFPSDQSPQTAECFKTENSVIMHSSPTSNANELCSNIQSEVVMECASKNSGVSFNLSLDDPNAPIKTPKSHKKPQLSHNSPKSPRHRPKRVLEYPPTMRNTQSQNKHENVENPIEPQSQNNVNHDKPLSQNDKFFETSSFQLKENDIGEELKIESPVPLQNIKKEILTNVPENVGKEHLKSETLLLGGEKNKLDDLQLSEAENNSEKRLLSDIATNLVQNQKLNNDSISDLNELAMENKLKLESLTFDDLNKNVDIPIKLATKNNAIGQLKIETIPEDNHYKIPVDVLPLTSGKDINESLEVESIARNLNEKIDNVTSTTLNDRATTIEQLNIQADIDQSKTFPTSPPLVSEENSKEEIVKYMPQDVQNENLDNTCKDNTISEQSKIESVPLVENEKLFNVLPTIPKEKFSDDSESMPLMKQRPGVKNDIVDSQSKEPSSTKDSCVNNQSKTEVMNLINQSKKPINILPLISNESLSVIPSLCKENSTNEQLKLKPSAELSENVNSILQSKENILNEQLFIEKQFNTMSASAGNGLGNDTRTIMQGITVEENLKQERVNDSTPSFNAKTGERKLSQELITSSKSKMGLSQSPMVRSVDDLKTSSSEMFKPTSMTRSTIDVRSYEDLLDKCSEQERLLGFDDSIKEEAEKLAKELNNASINNGFPSSKVSNDTPSSVVISTTPDEVRNPHASSAAADDANEKEDSFKEAINFDFEFLSKIRGKPAPNQRTRESLFLKFDPLASSSTPEPKTPVRRIDMALPDSSSDAASHYDGMNGEEGLLVSITPTSNSRQSREEPSPSPSSVNTPTRTRQRHSVGHITPTVRHEILSKEISKLQDIMVRQESSYQEQLAAYGEEIDELRRKLAEYEAQEPIDDLKSNLALANAEVATLQQELKKQLTIKDQLMYVIQEFESTSEALLKKRDEERKAFEEERELLLNEKETLEKHLKNMETSFNDVHQKYEKSKQAIELFKHNEKEFLQSLQINEQTIKQQNESYQKLKEHASQKLEQANIEILEMNKAHQAELAKLQAINKKMQMQIKTLEETVELKSREIVELTKICDELIKVSGA